jgi:hypothetical protein
MFDRPYGLSTLLLVVHWLVTYGELFWYRVPVKFTDPFTSKENCGLVVPMPKFTCGEAPSRTIQNALLVELLTSRVELDAGLPMS